MKKTTQSGALVSAVTALLLVAPAAEAKVTRYLTGNAADVNPLLYGPALNLGGGGTDVDPAIQWMIDQARGCTSCATRVDVVVLRSSGSNGYNAPIYAMNGVDSVETLVITSALDSNRSDVEATVRNAEVIFFAGGDQCDYVRYFKGTLVESAVEAVHARGGAVGGTSAGAMIQGEFVYDACNGSVYSSEALADPYNRYMSFTTGFYAWADMGGIIVDTHFVTRDRMGRTMAFLARQIQDRGLARARGIGIDEFTSVVVDKTGLARVMGGVAYFVEADHVPERCAPGVPLTFSNYRLWKVPAGGLFDLRTWPTSGYYLRSVDNGAIGASPY